MQQPMPNPEDIIDPTTAMNMTLVLMDKAFKLNYSTLTNNNQRISSNHRNRQIAQPGMNLGQDSQMQMVRVQNPGVQNVGNQNGLIVVPGIANQNGNGNVVAARAEGTAIRNNGIQLQAEEFDLMAATIDLDEIEETDQLSMETSRFGNSRSTSATVEDNHLSENNRVCIMAKCYLNDLPAVHDSEETLQLAQESRLKMKQLNKEIITGKLYTKSNHLLGVFVSQMAKSQEEVYFLNTSKTAIVSKSISIPNEEFLDDTTPSVARKFLNEVKSTIVTLQRVVKHRMTLDTHNWSSIAHQEIHKILKEENFPIINQRILDSKFEIQFLKESSQNLFEILNLCKEADDESLAKHKALELEIECLLRAVVRVNITTKTKRPQPRSNTKNDRVPSTSKSSCIKNKEVEVEEHHRNLLLSRKKKHMSSECYNIKLVIRNAKTKVVYAMYKQCLITANHDVCVLNYVNGMNSR
ncbi:hypothetical protein Tco_0647817, partial [Tanacetum coccineum]